MDLHLNGKEVEQILMHLKYNIQTPIMIKIIKKLQRALKPIKVSSRKQKGRNLQQQVCKDIARIFDIEYNQQDDNCLIHSREMGQAGKDIILRGKANNLFPFSIECKSSEKFNLYKAIEQAKKNMNESENWMVIHKKKNTEPIVILDWKSFLIHLL